MDICFVSLLLTEQRKTVVPDWLNSAELGSTDTVVSALDGYREQQGFGDEGRGTGWQWLQDDMLAVCGVQGCHKAGHLRFHVSKNRWRLGSPCSGQGPSSKKTVIIYVWRSEDHSDIISPLLPVGLQARWQVSQLDEPPPASWISFSTGRCEVWIRSVFFFIASAPLAFLPHIYFKLLWQVIHFVAGSLLRCLVYLCNLQMEKHP